MLGHRPDPDGLLGDAAHICNPAGGMGLNSGIHDVYSLAWRLRETLAGGRDGLLDDFSRERRRFILDNVQVGSGRNYRDLSATQKRQS